MVSQRKSRFLRLLALFGLALAFVGCAIIDLRDFNVRFESGGGLLLPGQPIIIRSDIPLNHPSLEQGFQLINVNDSSIAKTEFAWVNDQEAHVNTVGPLLPGRKYMAKFKGTISDAAQNKQQDLMVLQSFIYQTSGTIPVLVNQIPVAGASVGVQQSIVLSFSLPMDPVKLQKSFSIIPATEILFSMSPDNQTLTINPKTTWNAIEKHDWSLSADACSTTGIPIAGAATGWFQTNLNSLPLAVQSIACGTYDASTNSVTSPIPVYAQTDPDTTMDVSVKYKDCLVFAFQNTATLDPKSFIAGIGIEPKKEGLFFQTLGNQVVFQPNDGWDQETMYKITVSASLRDMNGNAPLQSTDYFMKPNITGLRIATATIQGDAAIIVPDSDFPKFPVIGLKPRGVMSPYYFDITLDFDAGRAPVLSFDRQKILDSISFQGYVTGGSDPVLDQYNWSNGGRTLLLNYRNIQKSDVQVPNTTVYYKLAINAGTATILSDGRYFPKPIEIVVRSDQ